MSEKITKTYQDLIEENVIVLIKDNPEGLKILNSIFKNLINFPKEKKYKTLKTSNQKLSKVMTKEFISILKLSEFQEVRFFLSFSRLNLDLNIQVKKLQNWKRLFK